MNISKNINKYNFKNNNFEYIVHNYDYFTTDYWIPSDVVITEREEYTTILNIIKKMDTSKSVIDVGANCGLLCVPCSLNGYTVYAFEPISMNIDLLNLNKEANNCESLHIIHKGLLDKVKNEKIFIPYCSDNASFDKDVAISNMKKKDYIEENVECITFDKWIEENSDVNVGFIKIDVQGFEKHVLDGMTKFLNNCNDVHIFIEWDKNHTEKTGNTLDGIHNLLLSNGFKQIEHYINDKHYYKL
jgi:FkbM family methyltransferase